MSIIYGRGRYPKLIAPRICRGCHAPVPKNRQTWCSKECYEKYEPASVKRAVIRRDKGICQLCGLDITAAHSEWRKNEPEKWTNGTDNWIARKTWRRNEPKPKYDHIIPFCEGGLTILENMRTLCAECHKKVTAEFRKRRAKARLNQRGKI